MMSGWWTWVLFALHRTHCNHTDVTRLNEPIQHCFRPSSRHQCPAHPLRKWQWGREGGGVSTVCVLVNGEVMHGGRRAWPGGSEGVYARAQGSCLGPEQIQLAPKAGTPCPDQSDRLRRNDWSDSSRTIYTDVDHYRQAQTQPETQSCRLVHRTGLCIDYQAKKMLRWKCQSQYQVQHCHKDGTFLLKCCNSTFLAGGVFRVVISSKPRV